MLSTYALITLDEIKAVLQVAGSSQNDLLERIINRTSEAIEAYLDREVVTRADCFEYHTVQSRCSDLWLAQAPVIDIMSIDEGAWATEGGWVSSKNLAEGIDYVVDKPTGHLVRISSGAPIPWYAGFEGVQVIYVAGWQDTAHVPEGIKDVALSVAARKFSQIRRGGDFAAQSISDGIGSVTRFLPADLLRMEREALDPWRIFRYGPQPRRVAP